MIAQWMESAPDEAESERSYLRVSPPQAILSAASMNGSSVEARIFHANDQAGTCRIEFGFPVDRADLIELDGRISSQLKLEAGAQGSTAVRFEIPKFGLRTVRVAPAMVR